MHNSESAKLPDAARRRGMRLAEYTDFTLRVLMCCAAHPERRTTIAEWLIGTGSPRIT